MAEEESPKSVLKHNLPSYHTLFSGRTNKLPALVEALQNNQTRLQTIVG